MPRYSLAPPRPDYPAAVSVAHLVSGALIRFQLFHAKVCRALPIFAGSSAATWGHDIERAG